MKKITVAFPNFVYSRTQRKSRKVDDSLWIQFVLYVEYWMNERMNISFNERGAEIVRKGLEMEKWETVNRVFNEAT